MAGRSMDRRGFLGLAPGVAVAAVPFAAFGAAEDGPSGPTLPHLPSQDPALVREVVLRAHSDVERVRELVEASPALSRSAYDWGFGDWESALGAASHMGRRDIAEVLIAHGARPDLFTFAMLGNLGVVRSAIESNPGLARIRGPHSFTLAHHARRGGERAAEVAAYLATIDGADETLASAPLEEDDRHALAGAYAFGPGDSDRLVVAVGRRGGLTITRGDAFPRTLAHVGDLSFRPIGAEHVRVVFAADASSVTIHDPGPIVTARRVG